MGDGGTRLRFYSTVFNFEHPWLGTPNKSRKHMDCVGHFVKVPSGLTLSFPGFRGLVPNQTTDINLTCNGANLSAVIAGIGDNRQ